MMEMVVIRRMECLLMKNSELIFLQFTLEIPAVWWWIMTEQNDFHWACVFISETDG